MTKTKSLAEQYILLSGGHSRIENSVRKKYHAGDLLGEITARELELLGDRLLPLSEFEARLAQFEQERAAEAERYERATSRRAKRSKEARKRAEQLRELRKSEKRLLI